jgi:hypothetical protein
MLESWTIDTITKNATAIRIAARKEEEALAGILQHISDELKDIRFSIQAHRDQFSKLDRNTRVIALRQKLKKCIGTVGLLRRLGSAESEKLRKIAEVGDSLYLRLDMFIKGIESGDIDSEVKAMEYFHSVIEELERELKETVNIEIRFKEAMAKAA